MSRVSVMRDGTFILRLEEGRYRIGVIPKTQFVKSMSFGSRKLVNNSLVIQEGVQKELKIVLAEK